jgi:hypothetical protein
MDEIRDAADMAETWPGSRTLEFGELPLVVLAEWASKAGVTVDTDVESVKHMFERWWRAEKRHPMGERCFIPASITDIGVLAFDRWQAKTNQADCDEINPGWHWLCVEATTKDGAVMLRQIKEAANE